MRRDWKQGDVDLEKFGENKMGKLKVKLKRKIWRVDVGGKY